MKIAVLHLTDIGLANLAYFSSFPGKIHAYDPNGMPDLKKAESKIASALDKAARKIIYTSNLEDVFKSDTFIFCMDISKDPYGDYSIKSMLDLASSIYEKVEGPTFIIRSEVPVGTADEIRTICPSAKIISLPEFIEKGRMLEDENNPFRLIVGGRKKEEFVLAKKLRRKDFSKGVPIYQMSNRSAELASISGKAYFRLKQSYAESIIELSASLGCDPTDVLLSIGGDPRIGNGYLKSGLSLDSESNSKALDMLSASSKDEFIDEIEAKRKEFISGREKTILPSMKGKALDKNILILGIDGLKGLNEPLIALMKNLSGRGAGFVVDERHEDLFSGLGIRIKAVHSWKEVLSSIDGIMVINKDKELMNYRQISLKLRGNLLIDVNGNYDSNSFESMQYIRL